MVEISNLEVVSHSMLGESPRPLRFRFMKNEEVYKGKVLRISDKNSINGMGISCSSICVNVLLMIIPQDYVSAMRNTP